MDRITLGTTGATTTRLGFGCSRLMGAMGRKKSLAVLEMAFDAGIRHFDVAPMYGYGEAESCVGEFLRRHRTDVTVTTKYGIPPPRRAGVFGLARSAVRPALSAFPRLKQGMSKIAGNLAQPAEKGVFAAAPARASLQRSLVALQTDRIDVWLMHEATAADLQDDDLLRLLDDSVAAGTIGAFGVGSSREKIGALLVERPEYCRVLQFEWSIAAPPVPAMKGFRIHHCTLAENLGSLHARIVEDKDRAARWSESVAADVADRDVLATLILKAALAENPESVILFSSKSEAHMRRNVQAAGDASLDTPARRLRSLLQVEKGSPECMWT